jgi:hypothetical protein
MIYPIETTRRRVWMERVLYALMIGIVTISLLVATAAIFRVYFNQPPVHIESLDTPPSVPVCPGMPLHIHNRVMIDRPTVLFVYVSVMDETTSYNMPGTSESLGPRPHPQPSAFEQEIPWTVPALKPGRYNRTFAIRGHDTDEDPLFLHLPFTVAKDCPK